MTSKASPSQLSFALSAAPRTPPQSAPRPLAKSCSNRTNTLAAVTLSIGSAGRGVYCWLDPGCETEQLRWIFGSEQRRFMLLFLAAELSSGPREGRGMVHHRHMAEGNLVRPKVTGVNLTSWPLVDLLSHGVMSPCSDQTEKGSKCVLYL